MNVAVNAIYAIAPNVSGFIAQLVQHRTGNREVTGSNPVEVLNFFQASLRNCINCVHCDDHFFISNVDFIVKKASKKLYSLRILCRAGVAQDHILKVYQSTVRPVLEYAVHVL